MSSHHPWPTARDARRFKNATGVDRHLGQLCLCPLIECCHNEDTDEGDRWRVRPDEFVCGWGMHAHSGSPVSGYTQPWEPGDESWRDERGARLPAALAHMPPSNVSSATPATVMRALQGRPKGDRTFPTPSHGSGTTPTLAPLQHPP